MKFLSVTAALLCLTILVSKADVRFESGPTQVALIELYTSEGCSSCPPAEAWLTRLKKNPGLWKEFVPIAFHVDYWDRLGWRDRFSAPRWTERQNRYASAWGSESVYTPAVVGNGEEERDWSTMDVAKRTGRGSGRLVVTSADGQNFSIQFQPPTDAPGPWDSQVALLACDVSTKVEAGENSGRNLKHDFVVLDLRSAPLNSEAGGARGSIRINMTNEAAARKAIAVWITRRGELRPEQAAGGWLR